MFYYAFVVVFQCKIPFRKRNTDLMSTISIDIYVRISIIMETLFLGYDNERSQNHQEHHESLLRIIG